MSHKTKSPNFEFPEKQQKAQRKARRLSWWSLAYQVSNLILLYLVMGSSQAMKTTFFEDALAMIPPIAFLVGNRVALRAPDRRFPYGYHRAVSVGYVAASVALLGFGLYLLIDGTIPVVRGEHPTVGAIHLLGSTFWLGWLMLAVLVWTTFPPVFFGLAKLPLARTMHDKVLFADARMNRAGWMAGAAAAAGVLGVGFGFWWADSAAAIVISLDIIFDGARHLKRATCDAMDEVPRTVDRSQVVPILDQVRQNVEQLPWVRQADVRLREQGHVFFGEIYVEPLDKTVDVDKLHQAAEEIGRLDWRLHDIAIVPIPELDRDDSGPEERG